MKLCRNRPGYVEPWKAIVITELSGDELALMRFLANLRKGDLSFPEGILDTIGRWESAGEERPLYASFRELDRLTRLFEYLSIYLGPYPDKIEPTAALHDSLHAGMMKLGGVVSCWSKV